MICQIWGTIPSEFVQGPSYIQGAESQRKQEEEQRNTHITQQGTHLHSQALLQYALALLWCCTHNLLRIRPICNHDYKTQTHTSCVSGS